MGCYDASIWSKCKHDSHVQYSSRISGALICNSLIIRLFLSHFLFSRWVLSFMRYRAIFSRPVGLLLEKLIIARIMENKYTENAQRES